MGWLDKEDVKLWIDYVIAMDPDAEIVLHGVSMGGATVMMTSGEELPSNVKAIIDDCGYTSVWDEFTNEARYLFHISQFPILYTASAISKIRAGYSFQEASAIDISESGSVFRQSIHLHRFSKKRCNIKRKALSDQMASTLVGFTFKPDDIIYDKVYIYN